MRSRMEEVISDPILVRKTIQEIVINCSVFSSSAGASTSSASFSVGTLSFSTSPTKLSKESSVSVIYFLEIFR